jgi:hypothetical protein
MELLELLADLEHDRWSRWQQYLHSQCIKNKDGSLTIPKEKVDRWERQIATDYSELTEDEKESDRKEARKALKLIKDMKAKLVKESKNETKESWHVVDGMTGEVILNNVEKAEAIKKSKEKDHWAAKPIINETKNMKAKLVKESLLEFDASVIENFNEFAEEVYRIFLEKDVPKEKVEEMKEDDAFQDDMWYYYEDFNYNEEPIKPEGYVDMILNKWSGVPKYDDRELE